MKIDFNKFFFILSLFAILNGNNFSKGLDYYRSRAEGSVGLKAKAEPINSAIKEFEKGMLSPINVLDSGVYLLRSYYYKGQFTLQDKDEKKAIFNKGKTLGESLIKKYPKSAAIRYWYLVNLGRWSQVYGTFAAAKEGVADLMRTHSQKIIDLDPEYADGGGYFMLGAIHLKSPYIPFILSWPSNKEAIKYLKLAMNEGEKTPSQIVYIARALYKGGKKDKAIQHLKNIISMPISELNKIEDLQYKIEAESLLADWG
jgi:tetratricopeptide (TPR) repeat protein